jgi:molybdopterin-containing oxidoreductase family iron-sulfur binding subunit
MNRDHAPIRLHRTRDDVLIGRLRTRFPAAADLASGPDRRQFLKVMAASLSLAGLAGCDDDDPRDQEVPPVNESQGASPGNRLHYASAALLDGFANGVIVTTSNGRPIKIEGNPAHPWSRGGTDVFGQASVLSLYDPYRSQSVLQYGRENTWDAFRVAIAGNLAQLRATGGAGLRVLTGPFTSPTQAAQLAAMRTALPNMHWHSHAAIGRESLYQSTQRVFGRPLETRWRFENARVIVALDGDFLDAGPHQVGAAKAWAEARRAAAAQHRLLPTYSAAAVPGLTAAKADTSITASPAQLVALAQAFLAVASGQPAPDLPGHLAAWFEAASATLLAARGAGIVQAGGFAAPLVQDTVHRINAALGNTGKTIVYTAPIAPLGESLQSLVDAMHGGQVQAVALIDTNPVYDAPASLEFADALGKVPLKIHAGLYADETAVQCDWHLPVAHALESWGDARAVDGTATLIQPCIAPIYNGRTVTEVLSLLSDPLPQTSFAILQNYWKSKTQDFEPFWHHALLNGFISDTQEEEVGGGVASAVAAYTPPDPADPANPPSLHAAPSHGLTIAFRADPTIWDGTASNNAWLQELPKPLSKLVWENAIWIGAGYAADQNIQPGDVVEISHGTRRLRGPAWIAPGQADDVVSITLGYGRRIPNQLATGLGIDAFTLRDPANPWLRRNITLTRTSENEALASTIAHANLDAGADSAPFIRTQQLGAAPVGDSTAERPSLYPRQKDDGRAWGMVIDLDSCIGCNACVTACQAENNIAVVGRDQVIAGREMHWLRIEAETPSGDARSPAAHFMPVPCMQCEQAPCEIGCPVEATLHDHEGLNVMVYNRCIGTRACSGYCPYKVRRFNYFDYSAGAAPSLRQQHNPDVTVRTEGVMEKCTFCVQRIAEARIAADTSDGKIADGAVRTACQAACPTEAIVFGDMADASSMVSKAKASGRNYALLGELNTRPRTTYLARLAPGADG